MKSYIKNSFEHLLGWRFWLEKSASQDDVLKLIKSLRPVQSVAPLIRIGPDSDGGYLVPDDLEDVVGCISPGVSNEVGFDLAIAEKDIDVHMVDASVNGPPLHHPRFNFQRKFVDVFEDEKNTRLDTLSKQAREQKNGDLILQMDIEGAEWRVLLDAESEVLANFRMMVIEFHDLRQMFGAFSFHQMRAVFRKLLLTHTVVHLHPNNIAKPTRFGGLAIPTVMEMTFYRNDRGLTGKPTKLLPHPLDVDSIASKASVSLPKVWVG